MSDLVKIIADSVSPDGVRLTTATIRVHRFIALEVNTHRQISKNAASNRARPFKVLLEEIRNDIAFPYKFGSNQAGMQSGPPLMGDDLAEAHRIWLKSFDLVAEQALELYELNVHKEVINRLLEPYMWHTILMSATSYQNFFDLRCSDLAQKEIEVPACALREVMESCTPRQLQYGNWHLPFIGQDDLQFNIEERKQLSVARCARVSYMTHEGVRDPVKDFALCQQLLNPMDGQFHASPFEHVARPAYKWEQFTPGNFDGWVQWRHILESEKQ